MATRRLAWTLAAAVLAYAALWGATWLAGDRSAFVATIPGRVVYPGVFLGGLPPIPSLDTSLPELVAFAGGVAGLGGLVVAAGLRWIDRRTR